MAGAGLSTVSEMAPHVKMGKILTLTLRGTYYLLSLYSDLPFPS